MRVGGVGGERPGSLPLDPFLYLPVPGVSRIVQDVHDAVVSVHAPRVLDHAIALRCRHARGASVVERVDVDYVDDVLPPIAEIVDVPEPAAFGDVRVDEHLAGVGIVPLVDERVAEQPRDRAFHVGQFELVEMVVLPLEAFLDDEVELMEGDMVGNRDLAPDGRFGFVDGHLQMVRGHTCLFSSTARNLWTGIQPRPTPHRPIRAGSRANDTTRDILLPSRLARLFPSESVSAVRTGERVSLRATVSELSFLLRVIARSIRSCANRRNRQT